MCRSVINECSFLCFSVQSWKLRAFNQLRPIVLFKRVFQTGPENAMLKTPNSSILWINTDLSYLLVYRQLDCCLVHIFRSQSIKQQLLSSVVDKYRYTANNDSHRTSLILLLQNIVFILRLLRRILTYTLKRR